MLMKGGGREVFIMYDVANPVPIVVVGDQGKVLFFHFLFFMFYFLPLLENRRIIDTAISYTTLNKN